MPWWSRILAVGLPLALSAAVGGALLAPPSKTADPLDTDRELRRLAQHVDRVAPQVVVLGNSVAHRNLDRVALGEALGATDHVASVWVVGSDAPTWLLLLDRLVYGRGQNPELVLVPAFTASFVQTRPLSDGDTARIAAALPTLSPSVAAALGGSPSVFDTVRIRRQVWRDVLVNGVRDRILATVGGGDPAEILATTLGDDPGGEAAMVPFGAPTDDDIGWVAPADSLLPELVDLVRDHGGDVVLVQMPVRADRTVLLGDPAARTALAGWCAAEGVRYVDLSGLPLGGERFLDGLHVDPDGRDQITGALIAALAGEAPIVAAPVRGAPILTREGAAARTDAPSAEALAPLGLSMAAPGDPPAPGFPLAVDGEGARDVVGLTPSRTGATAAWVYPGTTLRAVFPDGDGLPVALSALVFGGSAPVVVDGLTVVPDGQWVLRGSGVATDGEWTVTVHSPADGPWVLVRGLTHGTGASASWVVGTEAVSRSSASVLAGDVRFAGAAPVVSQDPAAPGRRPGTAAIAVRLPTALDLDTIGAVSPLYACTPVEVVVDGVVLPGGRRPGPGKAAVAADQVVFGTTDGLAAVVLDPERRCDRYADDQVPGGADKRPFLRRSRAEARWLYPGDIATFRASTVGLHAAAGVVEVQGYTYGDAGVRIAVRVGDEVLAAADVVLDGSAATLPLGRPVGLDEVVDVEIGSTGFVQVVRLRLVEGGGSG